MQEQVKFNGVTAKNKDTGRSRSADIDPTHKGLLKYGAQLQQFPPISAVKI